MLGQIINGLLTGAGYALGAVGISYTFGISKVMNFAYGAMYMLAAFSMLTLVRDGVPYGLAALSAVAILLILGLVIGRVVMIPMIRVSEDAVMIASLGISVAITNFALWQFGGNVATLDTPLSTVNFGIAGTRVDLQDVLVLILAPLVTGALVLFMRRTVSGSRIRAVAQRPDLGAVTGINVNGTYLFAIVVGVGLAALLGVTQAPNQVMTVYMGDALLLKAFTVAALAGMGSLWGALVVGLGVGVAEALFSTYVSSAFTPALLYAVLVVVLIFFPRGLFRAAT